MVTQDTTSYLRSFAEELAAQRNRVRNLIGDHHWLSDGTYKERLLATQIERHLPTGVILAKGFVADLRVKDRCSKEQDLLILDTSVQVPLFHEGGVAVAPPDIVLATVSVKSTMNSANIRATIDNQNSLRSIVAAAKPNQQIFTSGYYFAIDPSIEANPTLIYDAYEDGCRKFPCDAAIGDQKMNNPVGPDLLCGAGSHAMQARASLTTGGKCTVRLIGYNCEGLSTAILITTIIEHIAAVRSKAGHEMTSLLEQVPLQRFNPAIREFELVYGSSVY